VVSLPGQGTIALDRSNPFIPSIIFLTSATRGETAVPSLSGRFSASVTFTRTAAFVGSASLAATAELVKSDEFSDSLTFTPTYGEPAASKGTGDLLQFALLGGIILLVIIGTIVLVVVFKRRKKADPTEEMETEMPNDMWSTLEFSMNAVSFAQPDAFSTSFAMGEFENPQTFAGTNAGTFAGYDIWDLGTEQNAQEHGTPFLE
jgi:hypothetical protein